MAPDFGFAPRSALGTGSALAPPPPSPAIATTAISGSASASFSNSHSSVGHHHTRDSSFTRFSGSLKPGSRTISSFTLSSSYTEFLNCDTYGAWERFHKQLDHFPMVVCNKVREDDKRVVRIKEGNRAGCHVVIVDDLVQSGSTLIECQRGDADFWSVSSKCTRARACSYKEGS